MKFFRRHENLDARVEDARQRAVAATYEAEKSRKRRESVQKNVVEPLRQAGAQNHFAELIRRSLIDGYGNHS